jgi:hypothetical protein
LAVFIAVAGLARAALFELTRFFGFTALPLGAAYARFITRATASAFEQTWSLS